MLGISSAVLKKILLEGVVIPAAGAVVSLEVTQAVIKHKQKKAQKKAEKLQQTETVNGTIVDVEDLPD